MGLRLRGSNIASLVENLYLELKQKELRFRPHVWISTEWFSPYGVPGFAIPFYLFHPRLAELEKKFSGEVEGGTEPWRMQLLRHETGHAIDNAFLLRKSKQRQKLFGLSGHPYPVDYVPKPYSTSFVRHLKNHYAQAHPDEDWAETFAVWLDPKSNWQRTYAGTHALKKLGLADEILCRIAGERQLVLNRETPYEIGACSQTLEAYFRQKQKKYPMSPPLRLPQKMKNLLTTRSGLHSSRKANHYLRVNKQKLCQKLALLTNQRHYIINKAYDEVLKICEERDLFFDASRQSKVDALIERLSSHVESYARHRRHRIAM